MNQMLIKKFQWCKSFISTLKTNFAEGILISAPQKEMMKGIKAGERQILNQLGD